LDQGEVTFCVGPNHFAADAFVSRKKRLIVSAFSDRFAIGELREYDLDLLPLLSGYVLIG
jgi:hypothetical protein